MGQVLPHHTPADSAELSAFTHGIAPKNDTTFFPIFQAKKELECVLQTASAFTLVNLDQNPSLQMPLPSWQSCEDSIKTTP